MLLLICYPYILLHFYSCIKPDIHFANGSEQCVELHIPSYKATQLLNNYVRINWIEPLSMGHVWKPDCMPDQPDQQKWKWKEEGCGYCCWENGVNQLLPLIVSIPNSLHSHSQNHFAHASAWVLATCHKTFSPFHPHGEVTTPPCAQRHVSTPPCAQRRVSTPQQRSIGV